MYNDYTQSEVEQSLADGTANELDRVEYEYDALDRLFAERYFEEAAATPSLAIAYERDLVGNLLRQITTRSNGSVEQRRFTHNERDQIIDEVFSLDGVDLDTTLYDYDANGALISKTGVNEEVIYEYDLRQRLTQATTETTDGTETTTTTVDYVYDHTGTRVGETIVRTDSIGTTTETKLYLNDHLTPYGHVRVLEEYTAGGVLVASFVHGPQPISQTHDGATSFYLNDRHSGVRLLTDSTGAVTDTYDYDAFGNILSQTGDTVNPLLYRGEQFDPVLGMYNLRARIYDPRTGTFMSRDPWGGNAFQPITLNKYLYGNADPIQLQDPTGLFSGGEMLGTLAVSSSLASLQAQAHRTQEEQVHAGWLGKFFVDFMALNYHFTMEEEPILRSELPKAVPYLAILSKNAAANAGKRLQQMNSKQKLMELAKLVLGTYVNREKAELLGIPIKTTGFPSFSMYGYPRKTLPSWVGPGLLDWKLKLLNPDSVVTGKTFIKLTGRRSGDFSDSRANTGISRAQQIFYTWHHHEVVGIMVLVSSLTHPHARGLKHIGGVYFWEIATGGKYK